MALQPAVYRRERILMCGSPKVGKSTCWLSLAEWMEKTGSQNKIFAVDSDRAWEIMGPLDGSLDKRVQVTEVDSWSEWRDAVANARAQANPDGGDWLVIDMINRLWTASQTGFFEFAYDEDSTELFMKAKKQNMSLAGEYGQNWAVINKMYNDVMSKLQSFPGHVLALTPAAEVRVPDSRGKGGDAAQILDLFGNVGFKPEGQKDLGYQFHSLLLLQRKPNGERVITTIEERKRPNNEARVYLAGEPMSDWVLTYLVKNAHWRLGMKTEEDK